jgi:hypothetical protein
LLFEISDLQSIINYVKKESYSKAIDQIESFLTKYRKLIVYEDPEVSALRLEIKSLELQLTSLVNEKIEIERLILAFNIRHDHELGELILVFLKLNKDRLKRESETDSSKKAKYEKAEKEYREYKGTLDQSDKDFSVILSKDEAKQLTKLYRKGSRLCHPDIVKADQKQRAAKIFNELSNAYKKNDLIRVKEILDMLEKGKLFILNSTVITEKDQLQSKRTELRFECDTVIMQFEELKTSEIYRTIIGIQNWDNYFEEKKNVLRSEIEKIEYQSPILST